MAAEPALRRRAREQTDTIVVVGASAGGVEALTQLVSGLPGDFPAPVVVVLHVSPEAPSLLPRILARESELAVRPATDAQPLEPGVVYVAPPDRHTLAQRGTLRVVRGPQENGHRPAIDPLFRSAAAWYGAGAVAVVLTGVLDDGAAGAAAVSRRGGAVVVQDPKEAPYPSMPLHAIAADHPCEVLPVREIPGALVEAVRARAEQAFEDAAEEDGESQFSAFELSAIERSEEVPGTQAPFACPACGGSLWEAPDEAVLRFRCRVGHAFAADSLLQGQSTEVERALWVALSALEERAALSRRIADRLRGSGSHHRAEQYDAAVKEAETNGRLLRDMILQRDGATE
jgi:two-component system chemotaxis response regulator CheB